MSKELETKDSNERFELKVDDEEGKVSGLLSTFGNIDLVDDVVEAGAFKRSLNSMKKAGRGLKMLVNHSSNQRAGIFPVGGKDGLKETDQGLFTPGAPLNLDTQTGHDAFSDAKFGLLDSFSIGFIPEKVEFVRKSIGGEKRMIRRILEARLMETSLVVFPANPKAAVTGTKSRWADEEIEDEKKIQIVVHELPKVMTAITAELAALRTGPVASKTDSASVFSAMKAEMDKLKLTLKGAR